MAVWDIANVRNHDDNFNYDAQFYGYNASHKVPAWLAFDTFAVSPVPLEYTPDTPRSAFPPS